MEIKKTAQKDGSVLYQVSFLVVPKDKAVLSKAGKMLMGYSSGFKTIDDTTREKINVIVGWGLETPVNTNPKETIIVK